MIYNAFGGTLNLAHCIALQTMDVDVCSTQFLQTTIELSLSILVAGVVNNRKGIWLQNFIQ